MTIDLSDLKLNDLSLMGDDDRRRLDDAWNRTEAPFPEDLSLGGWVARQAKATPGATAVTAREGSLTYRQLVDRSARLAHHLRALGVAAEEPVAVSLHRSLDMVVALLAVVRAGAAYVPIDPEYPRQRRRFMLEDSGARVLLTAGDAADDLSSFATGAGDGKVLALDRERGWMEAPDAVDLPEPPPLGAVYVIYTSGSTGRPKGVVNVHRAVVNRLHWMARRFDVGPADRILHKTPFSFDVSVWELFLPLVTGGRLVVAPPEAHRDPEALAALIRRREVTLLHFVPSLLEIFLEQTEVGACTSLRAVISSGEALSPGLASRFAARSGAELHNLYGPTEAAIDVTHWPCPGEAVDRVPIGRPIDNVRAYVLGQDGRPLPPGVAGQLFLGGVGLARGYLGRSALTAERFVADGVSGQPGERLYATGDRVRRLPEGDIEYLGRMDHQVKLRGFRIELGEIESVLETHEAVRQAVVVLRDDGAGGPRLVGYVLPVPGSPAGDDGDDRGEVELVQALRAWAAGRLPDYMVPAALMVLDELPLNASGKVDRGALPEPDASLRTATSEYVAPRNELETVLEGIWKQLLPVERIGVHDNFFEVGGDSIISIQAVARARQKGLVLDVNQVFRTPTLAGLAAALEDAGAEVGETPRRLPLTAAQVALKTALPPRLEDFTAVLLTPGEEPEGDVGPRLERALAALVERHDALRARVTAGGAGPAAQEVVAAGAAPVPLWRRSLPLAGKAGPGAAAEVWKLLAGAVWPWPVAGTEGALFAGVLDDRGPTPTLLLAAHPLVVDAASWPLLVAELNVLFADPRGGESLLETTSFTAFAGPAAGTPVAGNGDIVALPDDWWELEAELVRRLRHEAAPAYGMEPAEMVFAAWVAALAGEAGVDAVLAADPRWQLPHLRRTVGPLTGPRGIRFDAPPPADPDAFLRSVKEAGRGAGDTPSAERPDLAFAALPAWGSAPGAPWLPAGPVPAAGVPRAAGWTGARAAVLLRSSADGVAWAVTAGGGEDTASLAAAAHRHLLRLVDHAASAGTFAYTPSDFPLAGLGAGALDRLLGEQPGVEDLYPLAPMQAGLLFRSIYLPGSDSYLNQNVVEILGPVSIPRMRRAWQAVVDHYPILRTAFRWEGVEEPLQVVFTDVEVPWTTYDWRRHDEAEQQSLLRDLLDEDRGKPFDLGRAPLLRICLLRLEDERTYLMWSHHHVLIDGWCLSLIWGNVFEAYRQLGAGDEVALAPTRPYRDYVRWLAAQEVSGESERFWKDYLAGFDRLTGFSRSDVHFDGEYATDVIKLSEAETRGLKAIAQRHRVTLNNVVQAAWALLLATYSGRRDVVFGVSVSGRPVELKGVEDMVGLFINTLPLRVRLGGGDTLGDLLRQLQDNMIAINDHAHVPLAEIKSWCAASGGLGRPIFDSLIAFENYPEDKLPEGRVDELEIRDLLAVEKTEYPMGMIVLPEDRLAIHLNYDTAHFSSSFSARFEQHLTGLLRGMLAAPDAPLRELQTLTPEQCHQVVHGWNDTARPLAPPVHLTFAARAAATPEAVAVAPADGEPWTYRRLLARAAAVARALRAAGLGAEDVVLVAGDDGARRAADLLGVLAAGGVYLAVDPAVPEERCRFQAADAGARFLLGDDPRLAGLDLVHVDAEGAEADTAPAELPRVAVDPDQAAYVFYTSGSTGRPKGVVVSHAALANRMAWSLEALDGAADDALLPTAAVSFDISLWEILFPLLAGGRLVLPAPELRGEPGHWIRRIREAGVTLVHFVPSLLDAVVDLVPAQGCPSLRRVLCGGEALSSELRDRFLRRLDTPLDHWYGPTETTISVTAWRCVPGEVRPEVPIGRPIHNARLLILDDGMAPLPLETVGEAWIGGVPVARGYLGRPGLTADRFRPDPWGRGGRLYRTGDRVRYLPDGEIEFVGRSDEQVKIRGHRVEPGEVRARLEEHPAVRRAAVVARGDELLVAYVVPRRGGAPTELPEADLRSWLEARLPAPMVPGAFVAMAELPRLPSGKLDRRALPEPATLPGRTRGQAPREAPRSETEERLVEIWKGIFDVDEVGIHDNFFDLGGHSLSAIRLIARVEQTFGGGSGLHVTDVFKRVTIAELARILEGHTDPREDTLLPLAGGTGQALVLVHPGEGLAAVYRGLAQLLECPVVGVNQPHFGRPDDAFTSVEEMARCYVGYLRRQQPNGPYRLGGWSFGGVVAFEMARLLEAAGEEVDAVVLIDSYYFPAFHDSPPAAAAADELLRSRGVDPGAPEAEALLFELRHSGDLALRYRPTTPPAHVHLLKAADRADDASGMARDPANGWRAVPGCRPLVTPIPGEHGELMAPGRVEAVAAAVGRALDPGSAS